MHGYIVLGSAVIGFLVGMTGAGGGALMTPMLTLVFRVSVPAAISSDLVAAVFMRPVGAAVHLRRGTPKLPMVKWLALGSVPGALLGAYLLHALFGEEKGAQTNVEIVLGSALLVGAAAMALRAVLRRRRNEIIGTSADLVIRPVPTVAIGAVGGVMVGLTSVGAGSLMIVMLLFLYPMFVSQQLVGTDLVQAIPLTAAAALGQVVFGHVEFGVTVSLIVGSVPAVFVGSLLSSRAPDRILRPFIGFVLLASGLKYVGLPNTELGWTMGVVLVVCGAGWLVVERRKARYLASASGADSALAVSLLPAGETPSPSGASD